MSREDGPIRDEEFRRDWMARHGTHCEACGIPAYNSGHQVGLTCHHIIKRGRSDEATNLLCLCMYCHDAAELRRSVRACGTVSPPLPWQACLVLKLCRAPEEYDAERLNKLLNGRGIETSLYVIPRYYELTFRRNRPRDKGRFVPEFFMDDAV